jgi:negative regulator of flagellin synthesis FlgM
MLLSSPNYLTGFRSKRAIKSAIVQSHAMIYEAIIFIKVFRSAVDNSYNETIFRSLKMAIENILGRTRPPITASVSQKTEVESVNKVSAKQAEKADSIAITGMAKDIKKAIETTSSDPVVDMDRVAGVKKALADGSYQINPERIAEKMLQHEQMMSKNH